MDINDIVRQLKNERDRLDAAIAALSSISADAQDDGPVPDEDENAAPSGETKQAQPPQHDQLQKAIEVVKKQSG